MGHGQKNQSRHQAIVELRKKVEASFTTAGKAFDKLKERLAIFEDATVSDLEALRYGCSSTAAKIDEDLGRRLADVCNRVTLLERPWYRKIKDWFGPADSQKPFLIFPPARTPRAMPDDLEAHVSAIQEAMQKYGFTVEEIVNIFRAEAMAELEHEHPTLETKLDISPAAADAVQAAPEGLNIELDEELEAELEQNAD